MQPPPERRGRRRSISSSATTKRTGRRVSSSSSRGWTRCPPRSRRSVSLAARSCSRRLSVPYDTPASGKAALSRALSSESTASERSRPASLDRRGSGRGQTRRLKFRGPERHGCRVHVPARRPRRRVRPRCGAREVRLRQLTATRLGRLDVGLDLDVVTPISRRKSRLQALRRADARRQATSRHRPSRSRVTVFRASMSWMVTWCTGRPRRQR